MLLSLCCTQSLRHLFVPIYNLLLPHSYYLPAICIYLHDFHNVNFPLFYSMMMWEKSLLSCTVTHSNGRDLISKNKMYIYFSLENNSVTSVHYHQNIWYSKKKIGTTVSTFTCIFVRVVWVQQKKTVVLL